MVITWQVRAVLIICPPTAMWVSLANLSEKKLGTFGGKGCSEPQEVEAVCWEASLTSSINLVPEVGRSEVPSKCCFKYERQRESCLATLFMFAKLLVASLGHWYSLPSLCFFFLLQNPGWGVQTFLIPLFIFYYCTYSVSVGLTLHAMQWIHQDDFICGKYYFSHSGNSLTQYFSILPS